MKDQDLKFRVWNGVEWVGKISIGQSVDTNDYDSPEDLVFQQFTGLKDKNNKKVFEGDIVKFKFQVGDLAWVEMDERETQYAECINGKEFVGAVERSLDGSINMEIVCGPKGGARMIFALTCVQNGVIIGNVFENPDLIK